MIEEELSKIHRTSSQAGYIIVIALTLKKVKKHSLKEALSLLEESVNLLKDLIIKLEK